MSDITSIAALFFSTDHKIFKGKFSQAFGFSSRNEIEWLSRETIP